MVPRTITRNVLPRMSCRLLRKAYHGTTSSGRRHRAAVGNDDGAEGIHLPTREGLGDGARAVVRALGPFRARQRGLTHQAIQLLRILSPEGQQGEQGLIGPAGVVLVGSKIPAIEEGDELGTVLGG